MYAQFVLAEGEPDHCGYDNGHQRHIGVCGDGYGAEQVGRQFDGCVNGCGAVGATDYTQGACLLGGEADKQGAYEYQEYTNLGGCSEKGEVDISQHGAEVGQRTYAHKN